MAIFSNHFIEFPVLLLFFTFMLTDYISKNFILYRTCYVILGYNQSDCALLGTNNASNATQQLEQEVQPVASVMMMTRSVIDSILPVFCSFIIGPWSNKHGRKPVLLSTFTGTLCAYLVVLSISLIPWASPWWLLLGTVVTSFGGGLCSMLTVVFCYITDITSESDRSVKMGILELYFGLGSVFGTLSSSYIFEAIGYTGVYIICATTCFIAILYIKFCIIESLNNVQEEKKFQDLFDLSVIVKTITTCFRPRGNKQRLLLLLIMSLLVMYVFVVFADDAVFFLFVREKFHWPLPKYTLFTGLNIIFEIFATMFVLIILCRMLKVRDTTIILYGFIMLCISSFVYGFAPTDFYIYIGSILRRSTIALLPLGRAAISKLVPPDDIGSVFAVTTSLETVIQLISSPLYTFVYNGTLDTYPGAFNFISAGIFFICTIVTSTVIYIRRLQVPSDLQVISNE